MHAEHFLAAQNIVGEGPLWHPEEQTLYWVDIYGHCFYRLKHGDNQPERFAVGMEIGALAFRQAGGLILATEEGLLFWQEQDQQLIPVQHPEKGKAEARFNDGKVDRQGRFWAGTMSADATSSLYRLDADLSLHTMASAVTISNGLDWSLDEKTMYYTDSPVKEIYAYDFNAAQGTIENRRLFSHTPDQTGIPDGLTIDSEGYIWSARFGAGKIIRYNPAGKVVAEIELPVKNPTCCCFGGPELNELYITSTRVELTDEELAAQPLSGDLFRIKTTVQGVVSTKFAG
ncbi:MAG: SMP-30/gluconolactonase/LRE family protein [Gammaproteobacteria bacterium]|nr:SMP-30/gluconolactonase/LRE family protein [Gammaproteobacteria bacterium]